SRARVASWRAAMSRKRTAVQSTGRGSRDRENVADALPVRSFSLIASVLFFSVVLLYWPVRGFEFVNFDDDVYVTANRHVQAGLSAAGVRWAFSNGEAALWHPLTWLSH